MFRRVPLLARECSHDDDMVSVKADMDGISFKQDEYKPDEKPTYGSIKKWVNENYDFDVPANIQEDKGI